MRTLRPQEYLDEFWPDSNMTTATIVNWIKSGKLQGTQTPTGRYFVLIQSDNRTSTDELLSFLES